jgi:ribosome-associated protein
MLQYTFALRQQFQKRWAMLTVNERIQIDEGEFQWTFVRSGGPGGQNVNKVASKAVLRWNVKASPALPEEVKARFLTQQHRRITAEGDLVLTSQRFRDQEKNRADCMEKVRQFVLKALDMPKPRRVTKVSRSSKARRVAEKRHRAAHRQARRVQDD